MVKVNRELITEDAMGMENYWKCDIHVFEGYYNNIKVTTPEDLVVIKNILNFR